MAKRILLSGETIARLINERDVAKIMIRELVQAPEFDIKLAHLWREQFDGASNTLRANGIPVV